MSEELRSVLIGTAGLSAGAIAALTPWSDRFFVSFNLFWIAAWGLSLWGLAARQPPPRLRRFGGPGRAALFPLWFLAIGLAANGVAHPLFAARAAGYFPGLITSPFVGAAGVMLLRRLTLVTSPRSSLPRAVL